MGLWGSSSKSKSSSSDNRIAAAENSIVFGTRATYRPDYSVKTNVKGNYTITNFPDSVSDLLSKSIDFDNEALKAVAIAGQNAVARVSENSEIFAGNLQELATGTAGLQKMAKYAMLIGIAALLVFAYKAGR